MYCIMSIEAENIIEELKKYIDIKFQELKKEILEIDYNNQISFL